MVKVELDKVTVTISEKAINLRVDGVGGACFPLIDDNVSRMRMVDRLAADLKALLCGYTGPSFKDVRSKCLRCGEVVFYEDFKYHKEADRKSLELASELHCGEFGKH